MAAKTVWGIDITGSSVKGVKMQMGKSGPEIIDAHIIAIPDTGDDEDARDEAVRGTLAAFIEGKKISKKESICISIPGHTTFSRPVTLPPVDPKKLGEIVEYEAQQYIPFPITDVVWDYHVLNPAALEEGEDPQVMLFAVRREVIFPYITMMHEHNLDVRVLQTNPVATYNFLKYDIKPESAVVALDIGAEYTSLIIIHQDNFWVRNLPIAGNEITKRLQKKLKLSWEDAEELKLKMSTSKQAQKIFQVIEPTLKELVGEVHRSMGYFKSQAGGVKFTSLILMGSGSNVFGLPRYFENQLQVKIDRVKSFRNLQLGGGVSKVMNPQRLPGFTTAVGLALQGLGQCSSSVNFLPKELQLIREAAKQKPWYVGGAVLAAIGVILMAITAKQDLTKLKPAIEQVAAKNSTLVGRQQAFNTESNYQQLEHNLNVLLSQIPSDSSFWIEDLNKIASLYTNNFEYEVEADGSPKLTKESNALYRVWPVEDNKIYMYEVDYKVETFDSAGRGTSRDNLELSYVHFSITGCVPHDPNVIGDQAEVKWCQDNIDKPIKDMFKGRADVKVTLDRKEGLGRKTLFPFRWDPNDTGSMEGTAADRKLYYVFVVDVLMPDYSMMYSAYTKYVDLQWPKILQAGEMMFAESLTEARKSAVQTIVKAFAENRDRPQLKNADVIRGLSSRLGAAELRDLQTAFGIAPASEPEGNR